MSRRYLIIVSVAAHVAIGVGIFISGIWKIERLDYQNRVSLTIGAMIPGDMGGGEGDEQKQDKKQEAKKKEKKHEKKVVKEPVQVEKIQRDEPEETADDTGGGGGGIGDGEGPGVGSAIGGGGGGGGACDPLTDPDHCQPKPPAAVCGNKLLEAKEQCDDGNLLDGDKCSAKCTIEQVLIPPSMLVGLRISGETQITPPDTVKTQMLRDGKERTTGSFKLCIDTSGRISSIAPIGNATGYPAYDTKITSTMRSWQYRPYLVNNRTPVPACSVVTFVYTIK